MSAVLDRERLCKLLGLLSSDFAGERAEAGRAADRLVRDAELSWPEIISPAANLDIEVREAIETALAAEAVLSRWEIDFLQNLKRQRFVSLKQRRILTQIIEKTGAGEARAA